MLIIDTNSGVRSDAQTMSVLSWAGFSPSMPVVAAAHRAGRAHAANPLQYKRRTAEGTTASVNWGTH